MKMNTVPPKLQCWIDARKRFHLSHAQIQMARELGLNPKTFGGLADYKQEKWKEPLPNHIETLYLKHFSKSQPDEVKTIKQIFHMQQAKKEVRKDAKTKRRAIEAKIETI